MAAAGEQVFSHTELEVGRVYIVELKSGKRRKVRFDGVDQFGDYRLSPSDNFTIRFRPEEVAGMKFLASSDQTLSGGKRRRTRKTRRNLKSRKVSRKNRSKN